MHFFGNTLRFTWDQGIENDARKLAQADRKHTEKRDKSGLGRTKARRLRPMTESVPD